MPFDSSEVAALGKVFSFAIIGSIPAVTAVVAKGALNIKNDAAQRVSGLRHAPAYPKAITYDTGISLSGPFADIGPDKSKRQGALGNLLEFGSKKNAPRPHMAPAAEAELPKFEAALEALAVKALDE